MSRSLRPLAIAGLLGALVMPALAGGPRHGDHGLKDKLEQLDLTEAQRANIDQVMEAQRVARLEVRTELRAASRALADAIDANADAATIAQLAITRHKLEQAQREQVQQTRAEVKELLTEDQRAELRGSMKERHRGGEGKAKRR
jgi:Spy/CpxP family protein refolding chaperone